MQGEGRREERERQRGRGEDDDYIGRSQGTEDARSGNGRLRRCLHSLLRNQTSLGKEAGEGDLTLPTILVEEPIGASFRGGIA